jgi:hypothetical protein
VAAGEADELGGHFSEGASLGGLGEGLGEVFPFSPFLSGGGKYGKGLEFLFCSCLFCDCCLSASAKAWSVREDGAAIEASSTADCEEERASMASFKAWSCCCRPLLGWCGGPLLVLGMVSTVSKLTDSPTGLSLPL